MAVIHYDEDVEGIMDWSGLIRDASIIIASWSVIYGIDAWRREFRGKRQIELAEDTLALFYEAEDAIGHIRNPASWSNEGQTRKRAADESPEESRFLDSAFVVIERYRSHQELFNKLYSMRYRFMAQFGIEKAKPFSDLHQIVSSIVSASNIVGTMRTNHNYKYGTANEAFHETMRMYEEIMWEGLPEDDKIKPQLAGVLAEIDVTCKAIITAKGTLYSLINWPMKKS